MCFKSPTAVASGGASPLDGPLVSLHPSVPSTPHAGSAAGSPEPPAPLPSWAAIPRGRSSGRSQLSSPSTTQPAPLPSTPRGSGGSVATAARRGWTSHSGRSHSRPPPIPFALPVVPTPPGALVSPHIERPPPPDPTTLAPTPPPEFTPHPPSCAPRDSAAFIRATPPTAPCPHFDHFDDPPTPPPPALHLSAEHQLQGSGPRGLGTAPQTHCSSRERRPSHHPSEAAIHHWVSQQSGSPPSPSVVPASHHPSRPHSGRRLWPQPDAPCLSLRSEHEHSCTPDSAELRRAAVPRVARFDAIAAVASRRRSRVAVSASRSSSVSSSASSMANRRRVVASRPPSGANSPPTHELRHASVVPGQDRTPSRRPSPVGTPGTLDSRSPAATFLDDLRSRIGTNDDGPSRRFSLASSVNTESPRWRSASRGQAMSLLGTSGTTSATSRFFFLPPRALEGSEEGTKAAADEHHAWCEEWKARRASEDWLRSASLSVWR